jgi:hypothetical protein
MAKTIASASTAVMIHDLAAIEESTEVAPQTVITSHYLNARINSVAWSHNSKCLNSLHTSLDLILASGADDGQIILSQASSGQKLHAFNAY